MIGLLSKLIVAEFRNVLIHPPARIFGLKYNFADHNAIVENSMMNITSRFLLSCSVNNVTKSFKFLAYCIKYLNFSFVSQIDRTIFLEPSLKLLQLFIKFRALLKSFNPLGVNRFDDFLLEYLALCLQPLFESSLLSRPERLNLRPGGSGSLALGRLGFRLSLPLHPRFDFLNDARILFFGHFLAA